MVVSFMIGLLLLQQDISSRMIVVGAALLAAADLSVGRVCAMLGLQGWSARAHHLLATRSLSKDSALRVRRRLLTAGCSVVVRRRGGSSPRRIFASSGEC